MSEMDTMTKEEVKELLAERLRALFAQVAVMAEAQGQKQEFDEFLATDDRLIAMMS